MRRLVVEFPRQNLRRTEGARDPFQNIKSIEVLHYLRQDREEFSLLCRIVFEDSSEDGIRQVLSRNEGVAAQVVEREKSGAYVMFMKGKPRKALFPGASLLRAGGGYLVAFEMNDERIRVAYVGDNSQIKETLRVLEKARLHSKVVSLTDARFSPDSPLNALTEKQRNVIAEAYRLGYYSIPRKISSEELARKLNIRGSALVAHRRKAELRLLGEILESNSWAL